MLGLDRQGLTHAENNFRLVAGALVDVLEQAGVFVDEEVHEGAEAHTVLYRFVVFEGAGGTVEDGEGGAGGGCERGERVGEHGGGGAGEG